MQLEIYLWENDETGPEPVVRWADGLGLALAGFNLPRDHVTVLGRRSDVEQLISALTRALERAEDVESRHTSSPATGI
jgi:hypothetical protein